LFFVFIQHSKVAKFLKRQGKRWFLDLGGICFGVDFWEIGDSNPMSFSLSFER
jgi:hypothetical protein